MADMLFQSKIRGIAQLRAESYRHAGYRTSVKTVRDSKGDVSYQVLVGGKRAAPNRKAGKTRTKRR